MTAIISHLNKKNLFRVRERQGDRRWLISNFCPNVPMENREDPLGVFGKRKKALIFQKIDHLQAWVHAQSDRRLYNQYGSIFELMTDFEFFDKTKVKKYPLSYGSPGSIFSRNTYDSWMIQIWEHINSGNYEPRFIVEFKDSLSFQILAEDGKIFEYEVNY